MYADLAAQFRLPLRVPFPPETEFEQAARTLPFLEGFPRDLVRGMIVTNSALLKSRRLAHPGRFIGTFFGRDSLTIETLLSHLEALSEGVTELMCHPAYDDPALAASSYRSERGSAEPAHPPGRRDRVNALDIELVTFGALCHGTATPSGRG